MGRFGHWEILIIAVIAVVIFGGKRLPELGKGLGKGIANFRDSLRSREGVNPDLAEGFEPKEPPVEERRA